MKGYSLADVADRVQNGTDPLIAIKEWVDAWNRGPECAKYAEMPEWIDEPDLFWVNLWLAGAAEYGASLLGQPTVAWSELPHYFSRKPILHGGVSARHYALLETPFAWRRRMLFSGKTTMKG